MMHKRLLLLILVFAPHSWAMEISAPKEINQNPFDLIPDDCIKRIADQLDANSRGMLRLCCRRFGTAALPTEKEFHITIKQTVDEPEDQYWQMVLHKLYQLDQSIQKVKAHNDIVLHMKVPIADAELPEQLSSIKNLNGLFMEHGLSGNVSCRRTQWTNFKQLLALLPNLKQLSMPYGTAEDRLPSILYQLKRLQCLNVSGYEMKSEDFSLMPSSITELKLHACTIWGIPQLGEKLASLRSLSLVETHCYQYELADFSCGPSFYKQRISDSLEKLLSPLAYSLEKLELSCNELAELPDCLASFEKLQEIDISQNDLSPHSLYCLKRLKNLRRINLAGNRQCESQKDLIDCMFSETVTISYDNTYQPVAFAQV